MINGVIFDFYGTLVESDHVPLESWQYLNSLGFKSSISNQAKWEANAFDGKLTPRNNGDPSYRRWLISNYMELAKAGGVPESMLQEIAERLLVNEKTHTFKAKPFAQNLIELCKSKGLVLGICSNWDFPLEEYLLQSGLPDFKHKSISCEIGVRKPHEAIFKDILVKTRLNPSETLFIGDSWEADILGSIKLGFQPLWVKHGKPEIQCVDKNILQMDTLSETYQYIAERI